MAIGSDGPFNVFFVYYAELCSDGPTVESLHEVVGWISGDNISFPSLTLIIKDFFY